MKKYVEREKTNHKFTRCFHHRLQWVDFFDFVLFSHRPHHRPISREASRNKSLTTKQSVIQHPPHDNFEQVSATTSRLWTLKFNRTGLNFRYFDSVTARTEPTLRIFWSVKNVILLLITFIWKLNGRSHSTSKTETSTSKMELSNSDGKEKESTNTPGVFGTIRWMSYFRILRYTTTLDHRLPERKRRRHMSEPKHEKRTPSLSERRDDQLRTKTLCRFFCRHRPSF